MKKFSELFKEEILNEVAPKYYIVHFDKGKIVSVNTSNDFREASNFAKSSRGFVFTAGNKDTKEQEEEIIAFLKKRGFKF